MLQGSQLPVKYWSEFARTANYLRNRQPVTGRDVTPFEALTGHPPNVSHLRILGQTGYCQVHLGNTGWTKYEDRAHKGRLVGYEGNHFYRILIPNGKVQVYSNINWIDNVPPKPTLMQINPKGVAEVNNTKTPAYRGKRRNDTVDKATKELYPVAPTSAAGERKSKRVRHSSVESTVDFHSEPKKPTEFLSCVRIPVREPNPGPIPGERVPREESVSPDTLSNSTLADGSSTPTPAARPTTRSITTREELPE